MLCVLEELILVDQTKISTLKIHCIAEKVSGIAALVKSENLLVHSSGIQCKRCLFSFNAKVF